MIHNSCRVHFIQVEDLEKQVKDTTANLQDTETRKKELEEELKNTVEKVLLYFRGKKILVCFHVIYKVESSDFFWGCGSRLNFI